MHAVGAAGLETATMVRYLVESGVDGIVLHDDAADLETAFWMAHRYQPPEHVDRSRRALQQCGELRTGDGYLAGIEDAAVLLIPVSWMLRHDRARLAALADRFVLYPDACFDLFAGPVIAVTGSYGKTTTSRFAGTLVDGVVCGNDREFCFDLGRLASAPPDERLVFETSNRHLANGYRRISDVGVVTGITLNHEPDHGSFEAYRQAKYRMAEHCRDLLYHESIPQRFDDAHPLVANGVSYGPTGAWRLEVPVAGGPVISGPDGLVAPLPGARLLSVPNRDNALAAAAAALLSGVDANSIAERSLELDAARPHYRQAVTHRDGRVVVNDAASCMPAATTALVSSLDEPFVLICGGDRERYRDGEFDELAGALATNPCTTFVITTGPMAAHLEHALAAAGYSSLARADGISEALERALEVEGAAVVFSPACGTGSLFIDKHERGELFDAALDRLVPTGQTTR